MAVIIHLWREKTHCELNKCNTIVKQFHEIHWYVMLFKNVYAERVTFIDRNIILFDTYHKFMKEHDENWLWSLFYYLLQKSVNNIFYLHLNIGVWLKITIFILETERKRLSKFEYRSSRDIIYRYSTTLS